MSIQDTRNELIRENLPKLIQEISGLKAGDEALKTLEVHAFHQIRNHRFLSTSSHVVKQKIEEIKEKLRVENCAEHAEYFQRLCQEIIEHPLCINHYEIDVQWSLIDFFITLAYNPAANLRKNKDNYPIPDPIAKSEEDAQTKEMEICKRLLLADIRPQQKFEYSDDDLSDWSDENSSNELSDVTAPRSTISTTALPVKLPEREHYFKIFDGHGAREFLCANTQSSWWLPEAQNEQVQIESSLDAANTAVVLTQHTKQRTYFTDVQNPSTTTERNLLRELIWMFFKPRTCKFFIVNDNDITLRPNVTIPSVTVDGLASFLTVKFLPYICAMRNLSDFCEETLVQRKGPLTYSYFAQGLSTMLEPIKQKLLQYESRLINPTDFEINTIIQFEEFMSESLCQLKCLQQTFNAVVLPHTKYSAHICAFYLLAGLMNRTQNVATEWEINLMMALLIKSMEMYCVMFDEWWDSGDFLDLREEFLIEKVSENNITRYKLRPFSEDIKENIKVEHHISKMIVKSELFQILKDHALEMSSTLSLLNDVGRMCELRGVEGAVNIKLHETLLKIVLKRARNLRVMLNEEPAISQNTASEEDKVDNVYLDRSVELDKEVMKHLTTKDEFLLLAFATKPDIKLLTNTHTLNDSDTNASKGTTDLSALDLFNEFNKANAMLTVESLVKKTLSGLLSSRLLEMDHYVIDLYMNKLKLIEQLQNLRKVMLLEVGDVMLQFYKTLFADIEASEVWANVSYLTRLLSVSLGDRYADIAQAFSVAITSTRRCKTDKVFEAVEELQFSYELSSELSAIVSNEDLKIYNKILHLLLKVKWALLTLENLTFSKEDKHRKPYAPYDFVDLQIRRLQQQRFWIIYSMQCIQDYLMTQILEVEAKELERKLLKCTNLHELQAEHRTYVQSIADKCFLTSRFKTIQLGIEQFFCLVYVLRMEWNSLAHKDPLEVCGNNSKEETLESFSDVQVDALEQTYVRCHQYLANNLNIEVFSNYNTFVSGLSTAFNSSVPY